jgi:hypothetical protein
VMAYRSPSDAVDRLDGLHELLSEAALLAGICVLPDGADSI